MNTPTIIHAITTTRTPVHQPIPIQTIPFVNIAVSIVESNLGCHGILKHIYVFTPERSHLLVVYAWLCSNRKLTCWSTCVQFTATSSIHRNQVGGTNVASARCTLTRCKNLFDIFRDTIIIYCWAKTYTNDKKLTRSHRTMRLKWSCCLFIHCNLSETKFYLIFPSDIR